MRGPRTTRVCRLAALLVMAVPAVAAAPKPDLAVTSVTTSTDLVAGQQARIRTKVANFGKAPAGASQTAYYLSFDERYSKNDLALGKSAVPKLGAHRATIGSIKLVVPNAAGLFRLIACADAGRRVKEPNEANNCRATLTDVRVAQPR